MQSNSSTSRGDENIDTLNSLYWFIFIVEIQGTAYVPRPIVYIPAFGSRKRHISYSYMCTGYIFLGLLFCNCIEATNERRNVKRVQILNFTYGKYMYACNILKNFVTFYPYTLGFDFHEIIMQYVIVIFRKRSCVW